MASRKTPKPSPKRARVDNPGNANERGKRGGPDANPQRRERVLAVARLNLSIKRTAEVVGMPATTLKDWLGEDDRGDLRYPEFVREYLQARGTRLEKIATAVLDGAEEDPKLGLEVLRTLDPETWRQASRQEVTGKDGGPVKTENKTEVRGVDKSLTEQIRRNALGVGADEGDDQG